MTLRLSRRHTPPDALDTVPLSFLAPCEALRILPYPVSGQSVVDETPGGLLVYLQLALLRRLTRLLELCEEPSARFARVSIGVAIGYIDSKYPRGYHWDQYRDAGRNREAA